MDTLLFQTQLFATLYMTGLIWFVQLVHYPMFANVPSPAFASYEATHQRRTAWAVGPPMVVELITAFAYLWLAPAPHPNWLPWIGIALVAVLWLSTALWFGPVHGRLQAGFDAQLHAKLVNYNWLRTACWTVRGLLLVWASGLR